ncbi:hypothetical protein RD792_014460 [Penstemon davidsonii]|uniref:TOPLESS zinc finger domain-containing protein n=1 Tax=Penstemon davidsonii TaxID=160366 RepID=A0ABR0CPD0_9LAMI|nr:hypothetical protein RD792_014460 [Penstemon davidsonii]
MKYLEALDRENKTLSKYVDAQSARAVMFTEVKKLLELNPLHRLCKNPNPDPGIKSLFEDHLCAQSQPAPGPWMTNTPQVRHPSVFVRPIGLNAQNTSVGTSSGGIMVWELGNKNKLFSRNFNVWDLENCSTALQVLHTPRIVQMYSYHGVNDIRKHLEIEAHNGGVNDIAFTIPNKHVYIITCGDDKLVKFVFSTAIDGKIKAWLYDNQGSRVDYDAPGHSATTIAYNDDGTWFFSFGTNKEGDPYLVEWNETEGSIKHIYLSLLKRPPGIVQFDTTKNSLVVGDNFMVKYWDLDNVNLLATTYANGGFSSTSYGAHNVNIRSPSNVDRVAREPPMVPTNRENRGFSYAKSRTIEEYSQCRSLRFTYSSSSTPIKVLRLTYTNSGLGILALASHGVHKLWKWQQNYANATGKANANNEPMLWEPNGLAMTNDISIRKTPFHLKIKLYGQHRRVTGLAFSNTLNVLVSSGANSQLFLWSADIWERKTSKYLQMPHGRATSPAIDTCIQFHRDEKHLLAVHEAHIAVYEAPNLSCIKQLLHCDSAYLPANPSLRVYPLLIDVHPTKPNQFALGLTDGGICILEPLESEGNWGTLTPPENRDDPSTLRD